MNRTATSQPRPGIRFLKGLSLAVLLLCTVAWGAGFGASGSSAWDRGVAGLQETAFPAVSNGPFRGAVVVGERHDLDGDDAPVWCVGRTVPAVVSFHASSIPETGFPYGARPLSPSREPHAARAPPLA